MSNDETNMFGVKYHDQDVDVLPSSSPRDIPRRVVMSRDSPRSEHDGTRNTEI